MCFFARMSGILSSLNKSGQFMSDEKKKGGFWSWFGLGKNKQETSTEPKEPESKEQFPNESEVQETAEKTTALLGKKMEKQLALIASSIKSIPDHPKPGIIFRDITSLVENPAAFGAAINLMVQHCKEKGINKVIGTESRGFIFGAPVALALNVPFVLVRKPGKLPRETIAQSYELEYGQDTLEIHVDSIQKGDNVLIIDDLLATGGTVEATVKLVQRLGGEVKYAAFVINLPDLGGEQRLRDLGVEPYTLVNFAGH